MSERSVSVIMLEMVENLDTDSLVLETFGLLEAIAFDYERFCRILDLDPDAPEARHLFAKATDDYAEAWRQSGQIKFERMIRDIRERWERQLTSEPRIRRR